jgi:hypothetical protein
MKIREFGHSIWLDFLSRKTIPKVPASQVGLKCIRQLISDGIFITPVIYVYMDKFQERVREELLVFRPREKVHNGYERPHGG